MRRIRPEQLRTGAAVAEESFLDRLESDARRHFAPRAEELGPEGLRPFLAPDVMATFEEVIRQREEQGLSIDASFVGLRELILQDATFDRGNNEAEVTVRFVAELTSVVRNASGEVVEGDPNAIKRQRDVWTFARRMGSNDPNWVLVATGG
jgi:predicted lipid-binding transport protein (Tim44 family)